MKSRDALRDLIWLLPAAATVRAIYLWQLQATPLGRHIIVDEAGYDRWAQAVAAGAILGDTPFYQAPLYPYALGAWYALVGPSLLAVRTVQAAAGVAAVAVLYAIGCRIFGRTAGRVAGVGAALYAPFLFYEGSILKETWAILLTEVLVLLLLRAVDGSRRRWFVAGVALGLLAMLRENALAYLPLLIAWNLGRPAHGASRPWRARGEQSALLLAGMLAALSPVIVHNLAAGGGLLLTTYQGGTNFYIGNHHGATGVYSPIRLGRETPEFEAQDARAEAERRAGRPLTPGEVSRFWFAEGLRFARERPGEFAQLQLRKLALVWNAREIPDTWDIEFMARLVPLLRMPLVRFGWIAPLGLLGIVLAWPFRRGAGLLALLTLATTASVAIFYVFARYRLPLSPLVLLFAGHAVARGWEAARTRRWRSLSLGAAALVPLTLGVHLDLARFGLVFTDEVGHQNLGFFYLDEAEPTRAEREFHQAIAINPDIGNVWLALARIHADAGDVQSQRETLHRLLAHSDRRRADGVTILDPGREAEAHRTLGQLARADGRGEEAVEHFRAAATLQPDDPSDWIQLGIELRALDRLEEALKAYAAALRAEPDDPLTLVNLANVRLDQGDRAEATRLLSRAAESCAARRPSLCAPIAERLEALRP